MALGTGFYQYLQSQPAVSPVSSLQSALTSGASPTVSGVSAPKGAMAQTGNAISPWKDEEKRKTANNEYLAKQGLSADASYRMFDDNGNYVNPGVAPDGMGGVLNLQGYSSNPYYLQGMTGVSRDQLAGTGFENISDKALSSAYNVNQTFANDLWVDPKSGVISSMKGDGYVSVGDIRKMFSGKTGQQYADAFGSAAPYVKPDYFDGANPNTGTMAQRQQALIAQMLKAPATQPAATAPATAPVPQTPAPDVVQEMLNPTSEARRKWLKEELARYRANLAAQ